MCTERKATGLFVLASFLFCDNDVLSRVKSIKGAREGGTHYIHMYTHHRVVSIRGILFFKSVLNRMCFIAKNLRSGFWTSRPLTNSAPDKLGP